MAARPGRGRRRDLVRVRRRADRRGAVAGLAGAAGGGRRRSRVRTAGHHERRAGYHTRWHDGLVFGALLVGGCSGCPALSRIRPPQATPGFVAAAIAVGRRPRGGRGRVGWSGGLGVAVVHGLRPGDEHGRPVRLGVLELSGGCGGVRPGAGSTGTGSPAPAAGRSASPSSATARATSTRRSSLTACRCSSSPRQGWSASCSSLLTVAVPARPRAGRAGARSGALPAGVAGPLARRHRLGFRRRRGAGVRGGGGAPGGAGHRPASRRVRGGRCIRRGTLAFGALVLPWLGDRWTSAAERPPAVTCDRAGSPRAGGRPADRQAVWAKAFAPKGDQRARSLNTFAPRAEPGTRRRGSSRGSTRCRTAATSPTPTSIASTELDNKRSQARGRMRTGGRSAGQRRQAALLRQTAPSRTTSWAPCSAAALMPVERADDLQRRSCARRSPSPRSPGRYMTTVVA